MNVEKEGRSKEEILKALAAIAAEEPPPLESILVDVKNLAWEKWD